MPILMNGNIKPSFMYERRFSGRINEHYIGWSDYNGKIKKEIYPLAIWLATKVPIEDYNHVFNYILYQCSDGIDENKILFDNSEWFSHLYNSLK